MFPTFPGLEKVLFKVLLEKGVEYAKAYLKNPANHKTAKLWMVSAVKKLCETNSITWDDELDDILAVFLGV